MEHRNRLRYLSKFLNSKQLFYLSIFFNSFQNNLFIIVQSIYKIHNNIHDTLMGTNIITIRQYTYKT